MKQEELKLVQAPLKDKYRKEPGSAIFTLQAQGRPGEGISCKVESGRMIAEAGLHPATGGDGLLLCSGDLLLEALVACAGVTFKAVSTSMGLEIRDCHIIAEGDLDFRGTLGVSRDVPVGFMAIRLIFEIDSAEEQDKIDTLIRLTERYCVVYQTLKTATRTNTYVRVM